MFSPRHRCHALGRRKEHRTTSIYGRFYAAPLLEDVRQDCVLLARLLTAVPVYDLQPERDSYYEMGVAVRVQSGVHRIAQHLP